LCKNIELNDFKNIITPFNFAVSNAKSTAPYFGGPAGGSIMQGYKEQFGVPKSTTVQTVTLDEIMAANGYPTVDLLKIDIEGGEINAFLGMRETFKRSPNVVILSELGPQMLVSNGQSVKEFFDVLIDNGFTKFFDITHSNPTQLSPERDVERIERLEIGHRSLGIAEIMVQR
ncbi:MAG: FkbM family methyltransferase, partial [Alphaproteobacteria bacterium]